MKVWLFDIDGTLIASGGAGQAATFAAIGEAFGVDVTPGGIGFAGRTDRAIAADVFRVHQIPNDEANWRRFREIYLGQLQRHLLQRPGQVLAGVDDVLAKLRARHDVHLGLLTGNIQAGAEAKLRHYRLWDHFAFGGFGDDHESRDDVAAQAVSEAVRYLRCELRPEDVYIIGDTVHDIRCARAVGARAIAVATGGTSADELACAKPDALLQDLNPSELLAKLLAE
jgi:phosphoglycolate phosphatase-like HAD superfamily hydrolase